MTRPDLPPDPTPLAIDDIPADPEERWEEEVAEVEAEAQARPRKRIRWGRWVFILLLMALAINLLLPQLASIRATGRVIRTMSGWAVIAAVAAKVMSYVFLGYMMHRIVRLAGQVLTLHRAFAVTLASGSVGLVAGGLAGTGGSSYRWLRDAGIRPEGALLAGWLPTLLNAGVMALFAVVGMADLFLAGDLTPALWVAFGLSFGLLAVVTVVLLWAMGHRDGAKRLAARLQARWARLRRREPPDPEHAAAGVDRLFDALHVLRTRGWQGPVVGATLGVVFDLASLGLLFVAARQPIAPGDLLAGYALPLLIGKVAVIPGGVGVVEAMMIAIYTGFGVPAATAVTVVLAFRVIAFWMPNLVGFAMIPLLQIPTRTTGGDLPHHHEKAGV